MRAASRPASAAGRPCGQLPGVRQMTQAGLPVGRIALFHRAQPIVRLGVVDRIVNLIGNATIRRDVLGGQGPWPLDRTALPT